MSEALIEKINRIKGEIAERRTEMNNMLKDVFSELSQVYFDKHPTTINFSWTQYTPYFMDGGPCEFSVNRDISLWSTLKQESFDNPNHYGIYEYPAGFDEDNFEDSTVFYYGYYYGDKETDLGKSYEAASEFLHMFEDTDLRQMFGDGFRITVSKDGVSVDHYDHD